MKRGYVIHTGTRFTVVSQFDEFRSAIEKGNEAAFLIEVDKYWDVLKSLPREQACSSLHVICEQCGNKIPHKDLLNQTDAFVVGATKDTSCCRYCSSKRAFLLADVAQQGSISKEDVAALRNYWAACAQYSIRQSNRSKFVCDSCNADITDKVYYAADWLICDVCAESRLEKYEDTLNDPHYYGIGAWRIARNYASWKFPALTTATNVNPSNTELSSLDSRISSTLHNHLNRVLKEPTMQYVAELFPQPAIEGLAHQTTNRILEILPDGKIHTWFAYELFDKAMYTVTCFLGSIEDFKQYVSNRFGGFFNFQAYTLNAVHKDNVFGEGCKFHVHPIVGYTESYVWAQMLIGSAFPKLIHVENSLLPSDLLCINDLDLLNQKIQRNEDALEERDNVRNDGTESIIFACPQQGCGQMLRVPRLKRKLEITCPKCRISFSTEDAAENEWDKGLVSYHEGDMASAIASFKRAIDIRGRPDSIDLLWLGSSLSRAGQSQEALPILQQAAELSGEGVDYHWLGTTYYRLGEYDQAASNLEKALELLLEDRGDAQSMIEATHQWLGNALTRLGRHADALGHFTKVPKAKRSELAREDEKLCRKTLGSTPRRWWPFQR